jgi:DNA-binding XRE family transcriptional regulator
LTLYINGANIATRGDEMATVMGNKINGLCRMNRITQLQLAKSLGMSHQSLKNKLNGVTEFKVSELAKIATMFGLKIDDLYYGNDFPKASQGA